ncbi:RNA-directed DNA polymerase, eukaryota, reverse transcriptase zinc-binding domain protein [Tanacetum coccineum]
MQRGLRQGDPLSPLLFLLVAEALQISILEACNKGVFKGVSLAESSMNVSLLQYADDALFFGEWSRSNAKNLIHILKCFKLGSGLKVNLAKSRLIDVGVPISNVETMAASLGCSHDLLPFIYLGLLVGVGCLQAKNLGLLGKCKWRFLTEDKALRNLVIKEFYGTDGGFNSPPKQIGTGGIWLEIIKVVKCIENIDTSFKDSFVWKVLNGSNTLFWKDPWCRNRMRLMDSYPRLFALETYKDCKISDRWQSMNNVWGGNWSWRFPPRGRAMDNLASLTSYTGSFNLTADGMDKWQCMLSRPSHLEESLKLVEFRLPLVFPSFSISDITRGNIYPMGNPKTGKILQGVFQITLWAVCKWRNRIVNAPSDSISKIKDEDIFPGIQRLSKTWIMARLSPKSDNWDVWITRPSYLYV